MPTFDVRLRFRYPAWDEKDGILYEGIAADSKAQANERARRRAYDDGHTVGLQASDVSFTATERAPEAT